MPGRIEIELPILFTKLEMPVDISIEKYYCRVMQKTSPQKLFSEKRRNAVQNRGLRMGKEDADFLSKIAAETIRERLEVTNRQFERAVDFLSSHNALASELKKLDNVKSVEQIASPAFQLDGQTSEPEFVPLESQSTHLITSIFSLHRSNDLPGSLIQIRKALVNDGLFIAALPGENTLRELRECLIAAEAEIHGTASLRVEPFGEIRQIGGLLQRAGFALPVVDSESFTIRYKNFKGLVNDLRAMGATNTLEQNPAFANRKMFERTEKIYEEKYKKSDGKIIATAEIIFMSGWSPDKSQQQPQRPGSAKNQLKDFL